MEVLKAFGYVALGMVLAHMYNWLAWRKYYEGRGDREFRRQK